MQEDSVDGPIGMYRRPYRRCVHARWDARIDAGGLKDRSRYLSVSRVVNRRRLWNGVEVVVAVKDHILFHSADGHSGSLNVRLVDVVARKQNGHRSRTGEIRRAQDIHAKRNVAPQNARI